MKVFKNLFLIIILVGVIILSFWISFNLGKNMLMPVTKKIPTADLLTMEADVMEKIGKITFEVESLTMEGVQKEASEKTVKKQAPAYMMPKIAEPKRRHATAAQKAKAVVCAYKVQCGIFASSKNSDALSLKLKKKGFDPIVEKYGKYHRVYVCASGASDAKNIAKRLRAKGFEAVVSLPAGRHGRK